MKDQGISWGVIQKTAQNREVEEASPCTMCLQAYLGLVRN